MEQTKFIMEKLLVLEINYLLNRLDGGYEGTSQEVQAATPTSTTRW